MEDEHTAPAQAIESKKHTAAVQNIAEVVQQPAPAVQKKQQANSPCAWLENLFVQKQAHTTDQSRSANNAAAAIEQMVNNGAVSRGQFGQIQTAPVTTITEPATTVVTPTNNNAYLSSPSVVQQTNQKNVNSSRRKRKHPAITIIKSNVTSIKNLANSKLLIRT